MSTTPSSQGLRGIQAGKTAICTVGHQGLGLSYRGYEITDLSQHCCFEEVAYLLLHSKLPTRNELADFKQRLVSHRHLPMALKEVLQRIPEDAHPMDVMRTGCSFLGNIEPEHTFEDQNHKIERMLAVFPSILNYWYNYSHHGKDIDVENETDSIAGHFLATLHGRPPTELETRVIDISLILYAEHEFNASTFAARVCAATLSDIYSCITAAIGTLRGPLHGGANEAAMALLETLESVDHANERIHDMLTKKEKIMGFGHAVYKIKDPRNDIIKEWSEQLSKGKPNEKLYAISCEVERIMKEEKNLFANADFFHASAYNFLGIPTKLFTPIFVMSRTSGWCAHIVEQRTDNKLIRPGAEYVGLPPQTFVPIDERE